MKLSMILFLTGAGFILYSLYKKSTSKQLKGFGQGPMYETVTRTGANVAPVPTIAPSTTLTYGQRAGPEWIRSPYWHDYPDDDTFVVL